MGSWCRGVTSTHLVSSSQEDDIEGIHIVAFAEEEDPGEATPLTSGLLRRLRYRTAG